MIVTKKVYTWILSIVMPVYAGAGAGLILGAARDFCIFHFTSSAEEYFSIFYLASAISVFSINTISLSGRKMSFQELIVLVFCNILLLILSTSILGRPMALCDQLYTFLLSLIWIYGAFEANDAFLEGKILLSRTREALSSLLTALLCLLDSPLAMVLLLGPCLSVLPFTQRALIRSLGQRDQTSARKRYLLVSAVLTSAAPITVQYWAYTMTNRPGLLMGIHYPLLIRLSTYIFQAIAVGASVLVFVNRENLIQSKELILTSTMITILMCFYFINSGSSLSFFFVPILLGITHGLLILSSLLLNGRALFI